MNRRNRNPGSRLLIAVLFHAKRRNVIKPFWGKIILRYEYFLEWKKIVNYSINGSNFQGYIYYNISVRKTITKRKLN